MHERNFLPPDLGNPAVYNWLLKLGAVNLDQWNHGVRRFPMAEIKSVCIVRVDGGCRYFTQSLARLYVDDETCCLLN